MCSNFESCYHATPPLSYHHGVEIGRAAISGVERLSGTHIYAALGYGGCGWKTQLDFYCERRRTRAESPGSGQQANNCSWVSQPCARALITPGTTLILTDAPVSDRTHSAPGFNILTTETK
jgi:hypothetical protein